MPDIAEDGRSAPPLISIIVPVYNRASKVAAALRSVGAKGHMDVEIIVVDDGSSDCSAEAAERALAEVGAVASRVLRQPNAGPGAARNAGGGVARGRFLAFFDSDDLWMPWTLDLCLATVRAHPGAALLFLQTTSFRHRAAFEVPDREEERIEVHARFLDAIEAVWTLPYGSCNVIARRDVFEDLDGFTDAIHCSEDTDFFLRADPSGECVLIRAPVMIGREIGDQGSLTANVPCVVDGLDYLTAQDAAGCYPGGSGSDAKRCLLLAGAVINTTRTAFAQGYPGVAYGVLLRNLRILRRGNRGEMIPRLMLTPILHRLKPQHYRFRWRPAR